MAQWHIIERETGEYNGWTYSTKRAAQRTIDEKYSNNTHFAKQAGQSFPTELARLLNGRGK
jgi:hypothetical protein